MSNPRPQADDPSRPPNPRPTRRSTPRAHVIRYLKGLEEELWELVALYREEARLARDPAIPLGEREDHAYRAAQAGEQAEGLYWTLYGHYARGWRWRGR